jgi:membrane-associated protease RseP (regulator of RpoE activity)
MKRHFFCVGCVFAAAVALVQADSVSLVLELEGALVRNDAGYFLRVEGERNWNLKFEGYEADTAKWIAGKYAAAKVSIKGTVRANFDSGSVQLRDRTVQVNDIFSWQPGVKITSLTSGLPAQKGGLRLGDVINELDGKEVTTEAELLALVNKLRGKTVDLAITRKMPGEPNKESKIVTVTLNENGSPLGVRVDPHWTKGGRGGAMPKGPTFSPLPPMKSR